MPIHRMRSAAGYPALVLILLAFSCSTPAEVCRDTSAEGNMGPGINSPNDEYAPLMYTADLMLFTSNREGGSVHVFHDSTIRFGEDIYLSGSLSGTRTPPEFFREPPLNSLDNDGSIAVYRLPNSNHVRFYFSSFDIHSDSTNSADIFAYTYRPTEDVLPIDQDAVLYDPAINSPYWDAHPTISADGTMMVFASDRPLSNEAEREGARRDLNLWLSYRMADGRWKVPVPLNPPINTEHDEKFPMLAADGTLYYCTDAYSVNTQGKRVFNIVRSLKSATGGWGVPEALPMPINTQFNDISPALDGDSLLFASDRPGGCGGFDLYKMELCKPVSVRGRVLSSFHNPDYESVHIFDAAGNFVQSLALDAGGRFATQLSANNSYTLRYDNPCYKGKNIERTIPAPCSPTPVLIKLELEVPDFEVLPTRELSLDIPFFVTGYYRPSTTENLHNLELLHQYNLLGNDDSTRYVRRPTEQHFSSDAPRVEAWLQSAADSLLVYIADCFHNECAAGDEYLEIAVTGYADTNRIIESSRYAGEELYYIENGPYLARGAKMTNLVLSELRAYYGMQELKRLVGGQGSYYEDFGHRIRWVSRGAGVLRTNEPDAYKRRISVAARLVK